MNEFETLEETHHSSCHDSMNDKDEKPTPLPQKIMITLGLIVLSEPMSLTIRNFIRMILVFPFVYFMVRDFGITQDEREIGYYVGFIASAFSFAQFLTSVLWGYLSDRFGRRPILMIGLLGNTVTMLLFGMSHSLMWAILTRFTCISLILGLHVVH